VSGLSGVTSLSAGYYTTCARLSSGAAWCWGQNAYGQVGDGTTTNRPLPTRVANLGSGC
jgi:alpha-tubulin suppressor-like RCC1 family protein